MINRLVHSSIALAFTALAIYLVYFQNTLLIHKGDKKPSSAKEMYRSLDGIEQMLNTLSKGDPAAAAYVTELISEVAKEESARTDLLQQRASSLLSAAALDVSIILASIGLMFGATKESLRRKDIIFCCYFLYSIILVFGASLYWTRLAFDTRPFVSFDPENLLSNMAKPGADLVTAQVVAVQQNYQVVEINSRFNTEKARGLRFATTDLFLGLFLFSGFCLYLLRHIRKSTQLKERRNL